MIPLLLVGCVDTSQNRGTFYITPIIDGVGLCDEAVEQTSQFQSAVEAIEWCVNNGFNSSELLSRLLDSLEPGGPSGKVQVGYQVGIPLLGLYENRDGQWVLNERKLDNFIDTIVDTERPVVLYIMANHFDTSGPLSMELAQNPENLMLLKNGQPPSDNYFGNSVIPFTLLTDESIPVNHYRFNALRRLGEKISNLPQDVQQRIIGITMAGEVHHLYPDFTNGGGRFDDIMVTDYSSNSIEGFQDWLRDKYGTIDQLNLELGSHYSSFGEINPPSKNIHTDQLEAFTDHYDSYAAGTMTISGWLWDPESKIDQLKLYVDGVEIGYVQYGYNRLDVYRSLEEVTSPNVGFRYDLDYREIDPGHHNAQIVAVSNGKLYLMDQVEFVIVDRYQGTPAPLPESERQFFDINEIQGVQHWLDNPKPLTALYYNPLAREWDEYRDQQVTDFIRYFYDVAIDSGLPKSKLFTHQILPQMNSSWNTKLFMGEQSISDQVPYNLGINLYGGATNSDVMWEYLDSRTMGKDFGVPEYHIQQWKSPHVATEAFESHYNNGTLFVSPYFMTIVPDSLRKEETGTLVMFVIEPDNRKEGSNLLYNSIVEFAKK
jgi:hypothetical protein